MERKPRVDTQEIVSNTGINSDLGRLRVLAEMMSRTRLFSQLGISFGGARDLYETLGYKRSLTFDDYWNMFDRGRLAKRIVVAPVASTWYGEVGVYEGQKDEETDFEKAWKALNEKLFLIAKLVRLDILAGVGQYAVLLLGFSGEEDLEQPLNITKGMQLMYVQPYHENSARIQEWEVNPKDERFGKPKIYSIDVNPTGDLTNSSTAPSVTLRVHHSRVLHVADGLLDNDIFGTPRLKTVFNSLMDLEKVVGGSAEMFWQGALGGKAFKAQEGASFDTQALEAVQTEIDEYIHGLRRYMRLQGVDVDNLAPDIKGPREQVDTIIDILAGDTGIPKRILVGSERGELASSQDEGNWNSRVEQRRKQLVEPFILRLFIDKLIETGILPEPADGYQIDWTPLSAMTEEQKSVVAKNKTDSLVAYSNSQAAAMIPEKIYLEEVLNFSTELIERIEKELIANPPELPLPPEDTMPGSTQQGEQVTGKKPQTLAEAILLNYNPNHDPKSGQFASGKGGVALSDDEAKAMAHSRGYKVPPAWTNVQVAHDPNAELQVKAKGPKGKTVYIYSKEHSEGASAEKFARVSQFSKDHKEIMKAVDRDFAHSDEAKVLHLINQTGFRIGGEKDTGAKVKAFGASTLTSDHVKIAGNKITFDFIGKKGVHQVHTIEDPKLAKALKGKEGRLFDTNDSKVRAYLAKVSPTKGYLVKDFRTHVATGEAIKKINSMPVPKTAKEKTKSVNAVAEHVSKILGNTPTMAKNAYIHPAVFSAWHSI